MRASFVIALLSLALHASAQTLVPAQEIPDVKPLFEASKDSSLLCSFFFDGPSIDLDSKIKTGYEVNCRRDQFDPDDKITTYFRIQEKDGNPIFLKDGPILISGLTLTKQRKRSKKAPINFYGRGFLGLERGTYSIQFLMRTEAGRTFRTEWNADAEFPALVLPSEIAAAQENPASFPTWKGKLSPHGISLSILLNIDGYFNLHASLGLLDSLLNHTEPKSVNLVVFNLERRMVIVQQNNIDRQAFRAIAANLPGMLPRIGNPKPVESQVVADFLAQLVDKQTQGGPRTVAILGHTALPVPTDASAELVARIKRSSSRFFYFEADDNDVLPDGPREIALPNLMDLRNFFGNNLCLLSSPEVVQTPVFRPKDFIGHFVRDLGGTIFQFRDDEQFENAMRKMRSRTNDKSASDPS